MSNRCTLGLGCFWRERVREGKETQLYRRPCPPALCLVCTSDLSEAPRVLNTPLHYKR